MMSKRLRTFEKEEKFAEKNISLPTDHQVLTQPLFLNVPVEKLGEVSKPETDSFARFYVNMRTLNVKQAKVTWSKELQEK